MKIIEFSQAQKQAIYTPGDIIVSAGAGCGKTATMIERIAQKLKSGGSLGEMLIVTFTRAAAADIKIKLAERLSRMKTEDGGRYARIAAAAIDDMPVSDIGTLHSFCQKLIRLYFFAAGVDPAAAIADEGEARLILAAAVRSAVDAALESGDAYFAAVYDMLCSRRDDNAVLEAVTRIVDHALSTDDPDGYLAAAVKTEQYRALKDGIIKEWQKKLDKKREELKKECAAVGFLTVFNGLESCGDYIYGRSDTIISTSYSPSKDKSPDADIKADINERYKQFKKQCKALREFCDDASDAEKIDSAPYSQALCDVARGAISNYAERKERLGKIDYSDLEHGARRVLDDEACAAEIGSRIKYVFIDEFQDVNPLQATIAAKLKSCGAEMFLVGDIKQSIYAFRRCSPEFFRALFEDKTNGYNKVLLTRNHRSDKEVIDCVNSTFTGLMTESFGGADYKRDALVWDSGRIGGRAELCFIADAEKEEAVPGVYSVKNACAGGEFDPEAVFVVGRVVDYIKRKEREYKSARESGKDVSPPELGDIAVLVRSMSGRLVRDMVRLFGECGIRCNVSKKTRLSDFPEATALADIARCVDDGYDDIALYTALRSPMGGFSDRELYEIAEAGQKALRASGVSPAYKGSKNYTFRQKVKAYAGELSKKLNDFYELREDFARYASCHSAADTLGYITSRIGYFRHVYEYYRSGSGAPSVEAFISLASSRRCDLHSFLAYIDAADIDLAVPAGGNAVNITTIHSSKGLEYDYVIVAGQSKRFNMRDARGKVIVSERGVAVTVPKEDGEPQESLPHLVEKQIVPDKITQEELRLFYVALTRAKHELTLCTKVKNGDTGKPDAPARQMDFMRGGEYVSPYSADSLSDTGGESEVCFTGGDAVKKAVHDRCSFDYNIARRAANRDKPIKTCVTAIAADADEGDYTAAAHVLVKEDGAIDAKQRGIAYHKAMELLDFSSPDMEKVAAECEDIELVDREEILRAAAEMKKLTAGASHIFKEKYFIIDVPCSVIGNEQGGSVLVQGVIDLLAVFEDGTAIIVDYKTTAAERLINEGYKTQLMLYARAVEATTPYKIKGTYLYSFKQGLVKIS